MLWVINHQKKSNDLFVIGEHVEMGVGVVLSLLIDACSMPGHARTVEVSKRSATVQRSAKGDWYGRYCLRYM